MLRFVSVSGFALCSVAVALAQQPPPPSSPPVGAQQAPTIGERLSRTVDSVLGKPAAHADADMRRVLDSLASLDPKPIEQLTSEQARQQPTPADAVAALLKKEGKDPQALKAQMGVSTNDVTYEAAAGALPARIYKPQTAVNGQLLPVVLYFHGGGWVIADIETYDASPRAMAGLANAIVVSVDYRRAPEHKFPAAHEDAVAAYKWVLANAQQWGGDPKRVAVMGESAGGNLAINTAMAARDQGLQLPVYQVLVYPVAGVDTNTPSYQENADARPLNKAMMEWFFTHVLRTDADRQDPRLDLVGKANLQRLPPTLVITAEIDPLRSEGHALGDKLKGAGVQTRYQEYAGVTHEFFGMGSVVSDAKSAQELAAQELSQAFRSGSSATTGTSTGTAGQGGKQ